MFHFQGHTSNCFQESYMAEDQATDLDFKWGKKRGVGGKKKEVRFYESFTYDGVDYSLYDCVYMHKDEEPEPYIGKLIKIWENADKTKKVKVHWFFRPSEISRWLGDAVTLENEIFVAAGEGIGLANVNSLVTENPNTSFLFCIFALLCFLWHYSCFCDL